MADPANPIHGKRPKLPELAPMPASRPWTMDDVFVAVFALLGVGGAVFLPLRFEGFSPTITSFLLATGLAALTYRYLGGVQGASFSMGTLKLGGALAALVGIGLLVHNTMASDARYQDWQVTGVVNGANGQPIGNILFPTDFSTNPSHIDLDGSGGFSLHIHSFSGENGTIQFPKLFVTHANLASPAVDLNPGAQNPGNVAISRDGHVITIRGITLVPPATAYAPPQTQTLTKISDATQAPPVQQEARP
jgi:hypothetical protein